MFNHSQVQHVSLLLHTHITQQNQSAKAKKKKKMFKYAWCMHLNVPAHIQNPSLDPSKCKILRKAQV